MLQSIDAVLKDWINRLDSPTTGTEQSLCSAYNTMVSKLDNSHILSGFPTLLIIAWKSTNAVSEGLLPDNVHETNAQLLYRIHDLVSDTNIEEQLGQDPETLAQGFKCCLEIALLGKDHLNLLNISWKLLVKVLLNSGSALCQYFDIEWFLVGISNNVEELLDHISQLDVATLGKQFEIDLTLLRFHISHFNLLVKNEFWMEHLVHNMTTHRTRSIRAIISACIQSRLHVEKILSIYALGPEQSDRIRKKSGVFRVPLEALSFNHPSVISKLFPISTLHNEQDLVIQFELLGTSKLPTTLFPDMDEPSLFVHQCRQLSTHFGTRLGHIHYEYCLTTMVRLVQSSSNPTILVECLVNNLFSASRFGEFVSQSDLLLSLAPNLEGHAMLKVIKYVLHKQAWIFAKDGPGLVFELYLGLGRSLFSLCFASNRFSSDSGILDLIDKAGQVCDQITAAMFLLNFPFSTNNAKINGYMDISLGILVKRLETPDMEQDKYWKLGMKILASYILQSRYSTRKQSLIRDVYKMLVKMWESKCEKTDINNLVMELTIVCSSHFANSQNILLLDKICHGDANQISRTLLCRYFETLSCIKWTSGEISQLESKFKHLGTVIVSESTLMDSSRALQAILRFTQTCVSPQLISSTLDSLPDSKVLKETVSQFIQDQDRLRSGNDRARALEQIQHLASHHSIHNLNLSLRRDQREILECVAKINHFVRQSEQDGNHQDVVWIRSLLNV